MNELKLAELLRLKSAEVPGQTCFCPEDEVIANYFGGILAGREHAALKRHLVECGFCMSRIGNLQKIRAPGNDKSLPGPVLADAKRLAVEATPLRTRHVTRWATASILVLAVAMVYRLNSPDPAENTPAASVPGQIIQDANERQSRNINPGAMAPKILTPLEGAFVSPQTMTIRWTGIPGTLYYDVRIVSNDGALIRQERLEGTQWALPPELNLEPGAEYFVRVNAYLAEARSVSSRHVLFTVQE